jgi:hypothetical protein
MHAKCISKPSKNLEKKSLDVHPDMLCPHTKKIVRKRTFLWAAYKDKNKSSVKLFWSTGNYLFNASHKKYHFVARLYVST